MKLDELPRCLYFEKLYSMDQEYKIMKIMRDWYPRKEQRMYLVGFLRYAGYTCSEVCELIRKYNNWKDYDKVKTERVVKYFFGLDAHEHAARPCTTQQENGVVPLSVSPHDALIDLFLCTCKPFFPHPGIMSETLAGTIADRIKLAAIWYQKQGFHVIPMGRGIKRPPNGFKWLPYQDNQPTLSMIEKWDWSYGLILLGTTRHCFLDIDTKSEAHPDGLDSFDEARIKGFAYERTKSGGYHVFGEGNMRYQKAEPVSIRGKGAYIVTAPTPGYVLV